MSIEKQKSEEIIARIVKEFPETGESLNDTDEHVTAYLKAIGGVPLLSEVSKIDVDTIVADLK